MTKASVVPMAFLSLWACLLTGCANSANPITDGSSSSPPLIGGDRDPHGCIPSAGYQWCEVKQKCLRVWEEPCSISSSESSDTSTWKPYRNETLGFTLKFPPSWDGYSATEGSFPTYSYAGFSFSGTHRPFELFKVVRYTKEEWETVRNNAQLIILSQADDPPLVCDGCCTEGGDRTGGGQFDVFQQERCAEVPQILRTFQLTE